MCLLLIDIRWLTGQSAILDHTNLGADNLFFLLFPIMVDILEMGLNNCSLMTAVIDKIRLFNAWNGHEDCFFMNLHTKLYHGWNLVLLSLSILSNYWLICLTNMAWWFLTSCLLFWWFCVFNHWISSASIISHKLTFIYYRSLASRASPLHLFKCTYDTLAAKGQQDNWNARMSRGCKCSARNVKEQWVNH